MSTTTNWGDIEQELVTRLLTLKPDWIRGAQGASAEFTANTQPKAFPWVVLVFTGASIVNDSSLRAGSVGETLRAYWTAFVYGSSGSTEANVRYGPAGIFAVSTAVREKLLGFTPTSQIDNRYHLLLRSESAPEPFGGTGAVKVRLDFSLDQLTKAAVT